MSMSGFYAIVLTEQLEDTQINYVDLLYTAPEEDGLPDEPVWNPFASYSRLYLDLFEVTPLRTIEIETTIATNAVSGTICSVEAA
jgi:hypothetical protein